MEQVKRILCVDDDKLARVLLHRSIQKAGSYYVAEAGSGQDCLNVLSRQVFDLVILDFELGDLNGFDVCKVIPEISMNPDVDVIISSVVDRDKLRKSNTYSNVIKVVQKPYSPMELHSDLNEYLAS